jgi:hypothetical protein
MEARLGKNLASGFDDASPSQVEKLVVGESVRH